MTHETEIEQEIEQGNQHKKNERNERNEKNETITVSDAELFEDFKNLNDVTLAVIPAQKIYEPMFRIAGRFLLLFFIVNLTIMIVSAIISPSGSSSISGILSDNPWKNHFWLAFCFALGESFFMLLYAWSYQYFKEGILVNLKHQVIIQQKIDRFIQRMIRGYLVAAAVLTIFSSTSHSDGMLGIFGSFIIILFAGNLYVGMELRRLGVPHLFQGLKKRLGMDEE